MARKNLKGSATETDSRQLTLDLFFGERVTPIPIDKLHEPNPHPFLVQDDDAMTLLADSIREFGVREPGLARPRTGGGYELLCGNRRKRACQIIGLTTLPVIVRELDDQSATVAMVECNPQRTNP